MGPLKKPKEILLEEEDTRRKELQLKYDKMNQEWADSQVLRRQKRTAEQTCTLIHNEWR